MSASAAISKTGESNVFRASLENYEISMVMDTTSSSLVIEVANASSNVLHRRNVSKPDVNRNTGAHWKTILILSILNQLASSSSSLSIPSFTYTYLEVSSSCLPDFSNSFGWFSLGTRKLEVCYSSKTKVLCWSPRNFSRRTWRGRYRWSDPRRQLTWNTSCLCTCWSSSRLVCSSSNRPIARLVCSRWSSITNNSQLVLNNWSSTMSTVLLASRVQQLEQNSPEYLTLRLERVEELLASGTEVHRLQFAAGDQPNYTLRAGRIIITKTGGENGWQSLLSEQPLSAVGHNFDVVL